jgi:hypothetical protein
MDSTIAGSMNDNINMDNPAIVLSIFILSFIDPAIVFSICILAFIDPAIVLFIFVLSFIDPAIEWRVQ